MIDPKNLLIIRTDRIGDVILSLPLAEVVKRYFPNCKVTYLLRSYTECLAWDHPYIDDILLLKESNGKPLISENVNILRKNNFDACVMVYPTFQTALITFLSGIKNRIGTGYRWYSFLFNHKIFEHRKYAEKHELEYNVNLLTAFRINEKVSRDDIQFHVKINHDSKARVDKLLSENEVNPVAPIVIIHPGSGGSAIDLPIESFIKLVEMLSADSSASIIITGLESEKRLCDQLVVNDKIKNFSGRLSLSEMIALIGRSKVFISNSTGPIHIAAALKKNTVGFYPKILSCSSKRWGPYSNNAKVFVPQIDCKDCTREQCERLNCMRSIKMEEVFSEVQKLINFNKNDGEINA